MSIEKRWKLLILMFFGIAVNYIDRVNISHAIVPLSKDLSLSAFQQGLILSAFSFGYVFFMPFGGYFSDKHGPYKIAGLSGIAWSVSTIFMGFCNSFYQILLARFFVGAGEAPIFPSNASIVAKEFNKSERGFATAIFDGGSYIGTAVTAPIVVALLLYFSWEISFYVTGIIGIIWSISWFYLYPKYKNDIFHEAKKNNVTFKQMLPLLKSKKVLGASLGFFAYNYSKSFYLTWFPSYMIKEKGFTLLSIGMLAIIPPISAFVCSLYAGRWVDKKIINGMPISIARKIPLCVGLSGGILMLFAEFSKNQTIIYLLFLISFSLVISASSSIWSIPADIAPNEDFIGRVGAIQNTFSNTAGIVAPIITGAIVSLTGSFIYAFIVTAIVSIIGIYSYIFIVGTLEREENETVNLI